MTKNTSQELHQDLQELAGVLPFEAEDLKGQTFAKGNMLGGSVPVVESATEAPWKKG